MSKQCAVVCNAIADSSGIPLGSRRQLLSHDLETVCLRYLSLSDLGSLYFVCHGLSQAVERFLSTSMHDLVFLESMCKDARLALCLCSRHCRRLVRMYLSSNFVPETLICRLLLANVATLQQVDMPSWSDASLGLLKHCHELRHLQIDKCPAYSYYDNFFHRPGCSLDEFLESMKTAATVFPRLEALSVSLRTTACIDVHEDVLFGFLSSCTLSAASACGATHDDALQVCRSRHWCCVDVRPSTGKGSIG